MDNQNSIVPLPSAALVQSEGISLVLQQIRPEWQARSLIQRVGKLLHVDPSSACQRIFNAAIHDLREKIDIAGLDIAEQAAQMHKLPPISKPEDLENYPTSRVIDLAYRMGLLTRPDWRRVCRCYEIRRDLEHEDDEYEAGFEDCVYIFKTSVDAILSKDPIQPIRIVDVKDLVSSSEVAEPSQQLMEDYQHAPKTRQEEICKFLISTALDTDQAEIVRQNAHRFLRILGQHTQDQVKLDLVHFVQEKIEHKAISRQVGRVCIAAGIFPYLRQRQRADFYQGFLAQMKKVGTSWRGNTEHGELLRTFHDCGGLVLCPRAVRKEIVDWMVLTYIGTSGGMTTYGHVRHVFYSDTAAPVIRDMFKQAADLIVNDVKAAAKLPDVQRLCQDQHISRRFEDLLDLVDGDAGGD